MSRRITRFRLYVAGDSPNSVQALANLQALCAKYLPNRHAIEVVDVFDEPQRALADGVLMTPTLMILAGSPPRRIVGTLGHAESVLRALGLASAVA